MVIAPYDAPPPISLKVIWWVVRRLDDGHNEVQQVGDDRKQSRFPGRRVELRLT
jgi:hypothetical protein